MYSVRSFCTIHYCFQSKIKWTLHKLHFPEMKKDYALQETNQIDPSNLAPYKYRERIIQ